MSPSLSRQPAAPHDVHQAIDRGGHPRHCFGHALASPSVVRRLPAHHPLARRPGCTGHARPRTASGAESLVAPGAKLEKLAASYLFTEGPAADRDGNVYFTDQPNDRIVRWDAKSRELTDWLKPAGRSNGTYFDKDGNLVTCADDLNELWSMRRIRRSPSW